MEERKGVKRSRDTKGRSGCFFATAAASDLTCVQLHKYIIQLSN